MVRGPFLGIPVSVYNGRRRPVVRSFSTTGFWDRESSLAEGDYRPRGGGNDIETVNVPLSLTFLLMVVLLSNLTEES